MIDFDKIFSLAIFYLQSLVLLLWSTAGLYFYIIMFKELIWPFDISAIFWAAVLSFLYFYAYYLLLNFVKKGLMYCRHNISLNADKKNITMSIIVFLTIFVLLAAFYTFWHTMLER